MATRIIGYVRVSTDKQAETGVSLEAQREKLEAYAKLYDIELVRVVIETESAKTLNRDGLQNALSAIQNGEAEGLLVAKLDRLTRSVRDLGELVERHFHKAALLSVSEQIDTRSAAGRLVLNVLASVSQWERETIGERTSAAMQHKKNRGEYTGGRVPYGYALSATGELVPNDAEQRVIAAVRKHRAAGMTLRAIAHELTKAGLKARTGNPFLAEQVRKMAA